MARARTANVRWTALALLSVTVAMPVTPPKVFTCPAGSGAPAGSNASGVRDCLCLPGFENQTIIGEDGEKCEPCRLGFFKEQLRNASCVRCAMYSWTLHEGSTSADACVCDHGHWRAPGAAACAPCPARTWKNASGDGLCMECPRDHFCPEGSPWPQQCPAHSSAEAGRAVQDECLCLPGFRAWRKPVDGGIGWDTEHACRPDSGSEMVMPPV
ncbi:MAG: hypothetical protein EBR09_16670 [Proteobacteria bacterium]|jgi:hypothetical protein|nr:hypothetical protein [Pseudomonadota bacterium]